MTVFQNQEIPGVDSVLVQWLCQVIKDVGWLTEEVGFAQMPVRSVWNGITPDLTKIHQNGFKQNSLYADKSEQCAQFQHTSPLQVNTV